MADTSLEILAPDQEVTLQGGRKITVREMSWKDGKAFLQKLLVRGAEFLTVDAKGAVGIDNAKLVAVVMSDFAEALISSCTGLTEDEVGDLRLSDITALLYPAVALNVRPEMIDAGKALAGRIKALVGASSAKLTTT